jgi:hypothetical protein
MLLGYGFGDLKVEVLRLGWVMEVGRWGRGDVRARVAGSWVVASSSWLSFLRFL